MEVFFKFWTKHGSKKEIKMFIGDGGRFLKNYWLEFTEIYWACYNLTYESTMEQLCKWMHEYREN